MLTIAEFSYNNTLSATMGITPFQAMYGINPYYTINQNLDTKIPTLATIQEYANTLAVKRGHTLNRIITWKRSYPEQDIEVQQLCSGVS